MLKYRHSYSVYRLVHSTMSKTKKRNRNIHSLSALDKFSNSPQPDERKRKEHLFGELIKEEYSPPFYKQEYDPRNYYLPFYTSKWRVDDYVDVESVTSGINDIKLIKSLSSSPSWSDDNDIDGSRKVQDELERMDRVLRGIDPIPAHYDMDEYKQWMETFPNISLFDKKETGQVLANKSREDSDKCISNSTGSDGQSLNIKPYGEEIKEAVIHNIYENITARLNGKPQLSTPSNKLKKSCNNTNNSNKTQSFLNECLKNSPFTHIPDRHKKTCFISRHNSREDEIVESPTFESLPLMWEKPSKNSEVPFSRYKHESLKASGRRKSRKNVILPPIENRLNSFNQFRSISATPTYSSMLSAKSVNLERKPPSRATDKL